MLITPFRPLGTFSCAASQMHVLGIGNIFRNLNGKTLVMFSCRKPLKNYLDV